MDRGARWAIVDGVAELDMTEQLTHTHMFTVTHTHIHSHTHTHTHTHTRSQSHSHTLLARIFD